MFLCVAYWIHLIHIQLGTLGQRELMQGVHKLDGFPHCVNAAAAIEEQTVRRLSWTKKFQERKRVFGGFPNFCCPERWSGVNRISHPDWVKICVDPNSWIKLRAKQKYKILSATSSNFTFGLILLGKVWTPYPPPVIF